MRVSRPRNHRSMLPFRLTCALSLLCASLLTSALIAFLFAPPMPEDLSLGAGGSAPGHLVERVLVDVSA